MQDKFQRSTVRHSCLVAKSRPDSLQSHKIQRIAYLKICQEGKFPVMMPVSWVDAFSKLPKLYALTICSIFCTLIIPSIKLGEKQKIYLELTCNLLLPFRKKKKEEEEVEK